MCQIQAGYFTKNGSSNIVDCKLLPTDRLNLECVATFSGIEIGQLYKAELKFISQTGTPVSLYTDYKAVSSVETFDSPDFPVPIPIGTYSTSWFVIYDINGNTVCSGDGFSSNCMSVTVTAPTYVTISLYSSPINGGVVTANGQTVSITVPSGTNVSFLATPYTGYIFEKFVGDTGETTTSNPFVTNVIMDGSVTGYFIKLCETPNCTFQVT